MKPSREYILRKTNSRCAYCGVELNGKFQVDHLEPQKPYGERADNFDVNHHSNLFAACASCNNYKSNFPLDYWRKMIEERHVQLQRHSQYRLAIRFGLIEEIIKPVVFYFETLNKPTSS